MSFLSLQLIRTLPMRLFVLLSVFALASCGGGGGGGSNNNSSTTGTTSASTVATLSSLTVSSGSLSSSFSAGTTSYSDSVNYAISFVTVNATTTDSNATVKVNGNTLTSGVDSPPISLNVGTNTIDVVVTAQDGSTKKTYQITVTRAANNVATLSALSINPGTFTSAFSSNTTSYSATVAYAVTSVAVNATTTDSNATYTVNGGSSLTVGANTIDVVVTAQDGTTTKTYSITVTRQAASSDATLSALSISSGSLSPVFSSSTTTYSDSVDYTISSVTVKPTATDSHATIKVNGNAVTSGSDSGAISLSEGKNTISVIVTAQDGATTKTYTITVKQLPALSALSLTNASLDQTFQGTQTSYTSSVNFLVNAIGVTAKLQNSGDSLTISGQSATSGTEMSPVYLATGTHNVDTVVTATDGTTTQTYSIAMTRNTSLAQQEHTATDAATGDDYGVSVAISGNTMVVGADNKSTSTHSNNGAVYVYGRSSSSASWTYEKTLTASNAADYDKFGTSVAIDGNTIVVGAPYRTLPVTGGTQYGAGAAYVFTKSGGSWSQTAYIPDENITGSDHFGISVAVSGNTLVVGANNTSSKGTAYVYINSTGTSWVPQGTLVGTDTAQYDQFANSVALDKDTIVVGAPLHDSTNANNDGAAYIFTRSGSTWTQVTTVLNEGGSSVLGDKFGQTVAVSGNTIAVGATGVNSGTGAVYVFYNDGSGWAQQGSILTAANPDTGDAFGNSIALSGERLVVGAKWEDGDASSKTGGYNNSATDTGAVYVFMRNGASWSQTAYLKAADALNSDYFGSSIAIDNDTLVIGAPNKAVSTYSGAGAIYTFQ